MNTVKSSSLMNGVAMKFLTYLGAFLSTVAVAQDQETYMSAKKKTYEEIKKQEAHPENPVDQFKSNLKIKKLHVQSQIELCKTFPNDCYIKHKEFLKSIEKEYDDATRDLFLSIFKSEEHHVDWPETQSDLL
jgi:hypothetical protein